MTQNLECYFAVEKYFFPIIKFWRPDKKLLLFDLLILIRRNCIFSPLSFRRIPLLSLVSTRSLLKNKKRISDTFTFCFSWYWYEMVQPLKLHFYREIIIFNYYFCTLQKHINSYCWANVVSHIRITFSFTI